MRYMADVLPAIRSHLSLRRVLGVGLVLVVGVVVAVGATWWRHPKVLTLFGASYGGVVQPLAESRVAIDVAIPRDGHDSETITFTRVKVHFVTNTAHATATLAECVRRPGQEVIGVVRPSDLATYCSRVLPIHNGMRMVWTEGESTDRYLLLTAQATSLGDVRIDGVSISYRRDWKHLYQHGTQDLGLHVRLLVGPPAHI
jgi:hypothetical protein